MRPKLKIAKRFAGLTLIEVVIASVLLIVAIVPILKGLSIAHAGAAVIEHKSRSLVLAQAKLDEIKARSVYHYSSSFAVNNYSLGSSYLCTVTDSPVNSYLRTITVQVGYDLNGDASLASSEVNITLATLLAQRW